MGIQGLTKFIKDKYPSIIKDIHIKDLRYKKIAVDTNLYLFKYKCVSEDQWLSLFINMISCLRKNDVHPVFIVDTKAPIEKSEEQQHRREQLKLREENIEKLKQSVEKYENEKTIDDELLEFFNKKKTKKKTEMLNKLGLIHEFDIEYVKTEIEKLKQTIVRVTDEDKQQLKTLLNILGIQYLEAIGEGEQTCAYLNHWGLVDAVLTEDSDAIAYGCKIFISKFNISTGICRIIETEHLLKKMNITKEQLLDFCIMIQCDYNKRVPKLGPVSSFKLISKHGSLENIEKETSYNLDCLKYKRCREIFRCVEDTGLFDIKYCGHPNFDELDRFVDINNLNISFDRVKQNCDFIVIE